MKKKEERKGDTKGENGEVAGRGRRVEAEMEIREVRNPNLEA